MICKGVRLAFAPSGVVRLRRDEAQPLHTRESNWSASSKSLSNTETVFSSAVLFLYLPNVL